MFICQINIIMIGLVGPIQQKIVVYLALLIDALIDDIFEPTK